MPKIMIWIAGIALMLTAIFSKTGCEQSTTPVKVSNIRRVFLQNEWKYIVYIQEEGSPTVTSMTLDSRSKKVEIVADVPPGEPMYATGTFVEVKADYDYFRDWVIHIHNPQSIEGAENEERVGKNTIRRNRNSPVE